MANGQSLLHKACLTEDVSLKNVFIEALLQLGLNPNETDSNGRTPISYLLTKESKHSLYGAIELHLKTHKFEVLKEPESGGDSFFYELIRSGQATESILKLMKQQLQHLSIDDIENLLHALQKN